MHPGPLLSPWLAAPSAHAGAAAGVSRRTWRALKRGRLLAQEPYMKAEDARTRLHTLFPTCSGCSHGHLPLLTAPQLSALGPASGKREQDPSQFSQWQDHRKQTRPSGTCV